MKKTIITTIFTLFTFVVFAQRQLSINGSYNTDVVLAIGPEIDHLYRNVFFGANASYPLKKKAEQEIPGYKNRFVSAKEGLGVKIKLGYHVSNIITVYGFYQYSHINKTYVTYVPKTPMNPEGKQTSYTGDFDVYQRYGLGIRAKVTQRFSVNLDYAVNNHLVCVGVSVNFGERFGKKQKEVKKKETENQVVE